MQLKNCGLQFTSRLYELFHITVEQQGKNFNDNTKQMCGMFQYLYFDAGR